MRILSERRGWVTGWLGTVSAGATFASGTVVVRRDVRGAGVGAPGLLAVDCEDVGVGASLCSLAGYDVNVGVGIVVGTGLFTGWNVPAGTRNSDCLVGCTIGEFILSELSSMLDSCFVIKRVERSS